MKKTIRLLALLSVFCIAAIPLAAQKLIPTLKEVSLHSLEDFQSPTGNWQITGAVYASYDDTVLFSSPGVGVLVNKFTKADQFKPGRELKTKLEHGDMVMEAEIMVPKNSNSGIYLQSRYEVQIFDSWRTQSPRHSDMGGIYQRWKNDRGYEGKAPLTNASFAPGLWQHLEVSFQAPRFDAAGKKVSQAKFIYVKLNGVTIHENILVSGPTRSAAFEDERPYAPLMIQGDHGPVAIRNMKIALQEDLDVSVSDISYKYYEKTAKTLEEASNVKPTSQGRAAAIDIRVAPSREEHFIIFEGRLNVPAKDQYSFSFFPGGIGSLEIDGKTLIAPERGSIFQDPLRGKIDLEAGPHNFKLWMSKTNRWMAPALALYIEKPGTKAVALHAPASVPEQTPAPLFSVKAEKNTEIIRSFMEHQGKKLTHVLSVGDPSGLNYSYDLLQGSILQLWRGDFLNTTEMWYERGEPQLASPLGASIVLAGGCPVFDAMASKDSVSDYKYKGYSLTANSTPVYNYDYRTVKITDEIVPSEQSKGLARTLKFTGDDMEKIRIRLATAGKINLIRNELYSIDEGRYFIEVAKGLNPFIENYMGKQVLLVKASGSINYQMIW